MSNNWADSSTDKATHNGLTAFGNMTDDMMRALARNGGVMMIHDHAAFLSEEFRVASEKKSGRGGCG